MTHSLDPSSVITPDNLFDDRMLISHERTDSTNSNDTIYGNSLPLELKDLVLTPTAAKLVSTTTHTDSRFSPAHSEDSLSRRSSTSNPTMFFGLAAPPLPKQKSFGQRILKQIFSINVMFTVVIVVAVVIAVGAVTASSLTSGSNIVFGLGSTMRDSLSNQVCFIFLHILTSLGSCKYRTNVYSNSEKYGSHTNHF